MPAITHAAQQGVVSATAASSHGRSTCAPTPSERAYPLARASSVLHRPSEHPRRSHPSVAWGTSFTMRAGCERDARVV
jgi:hypothetical protein